MEDTALCVRLLINVLLLLPAQVQYSCSLRADATFPHIIPSRLQFFEYESVSVNCERSLNNLTEWRVFRRVKGRNITCNNKWEITGSCNITNVFSSDTGEYWCDAKEKKSNIVSIIVTAGPVMLESPVLPVIEGEAVTLSCRQKKMSSLDAHFYKDGLLIQNSSTGNMTIHNVSKSDEGLYKCNISGAGESPESRLAVRANQEQTYFSNGPAPHVFNLLWIVVPVVLVTFLLLVVGLCSMKHKGSASTCPPSFARPSPPQTETSAAEPQQATYTVVTKPKKDKDKDESLTSPVYHTLSLGHCQERHLTEGESKRKYVV